MQSAIRPEYCTVQYVTLLKSTVQYSTVQYCTVQCDKELSTVQIFNSQMANICINYKNFALITNIVTGYTTEQNSVLLVTHIYSCFCSRESGGKLIYKSPYASILLQMLPIRQEQIIDYSTELFKKQLCTQCTSQLQQ